MAKAGKRSYRALDFTPPPKRRQLETKELVLTLGVPEGELIKVERLEKSGQRHEISEEEFAALAGEDEAEDLGAALEEAYAAGVTDAIDDELMGEDKEESFRHFILRRAAGRRLLRRGVRRLILRRLIRRELIQRRVQPDRKVDPNGPKE